MYKKLLFFLLLLPFTSLGQERLNKLVNERQQLHQQWQQSEQKKSGIFGNRTKKDMIATNEWMERIIQKDNQIMQELEMLKNIETTEISYEKDDYKFIAQKQEQDIGKLKRALADMEERVGEEKSNKRTYEWTTFIFFLTSLTFGIMYFKSRKSAGLAKETGRFS
ncbi:MAG TPA: hypothetical protein VK014_16345 [Cyclobacteriaceae bacterium]|nr:hypothetical protein [Cyclobacteriaceae bacterium]